MVWDNSMTSELNWDIFIKNWNLLNNNQEFNLPENQKEKKRKVKSDGILKDQKNKRKHTSHSSRTFEKSKKETLEPVNFEQSDL